MDFSELKKLAQDAANPRTLSSHAECGSVGAAIETDDGRVYRGICIDTESSMGFCAEHAAVAAMLLDGGSVIRRAVACTKSGKVLPPCGRCRELISQISDENWDAEFLVDDDTVVTLRALLPYGD